MNTPPATANPAETAPANAGLQGLRPAHIPELDVLRGFLLVWMTCTHLPTRLSAYSNQMVGYVSAAEGFIFLAAFLTGQVHCRTEVRHGWQTAIRRLWSRALRIYCYHAALLAIAFTGVAAVAVWLDRMPLTNLLHFYLANPKEAFVAAVVLLYSPPLLDILPMYVIFTLETPLVLRAARKFGWTAVAAVSGGVWMLAQFGFRSWLYGVANRHGFAVPVQESGAFDLFAWQFLWVLGLALGTYSFARPLSAVRIPRAFQILITICAVAFLALRHSPFDALTAQGLLGVLVNKWHLGVLRLFDLAAVTFLLVRFGAALARWKRVLPLASLGRSSLQVFSAHVLLCLAVLGLSREADPHFAWWQDALILTAVVSTLFWVAARAGRRRPGRSSSGDSLPFAARHLSSSAMLCPTAVRCPSSPR